MQNHISIHMAIITLKMGVVILQGPFFTYLDISCIGFLTQASGHTMLRKREIKIALLNVTSTLCSIKLLLLQLFWAVYVKCHDSKFEGSNIYKLQNASGDIYW